MLTSRTLFKWIAHFSKTESPCLTKYLKPCKEVSEKNSQTIITMSLAIKKSLEESELTVSIMLKYDASYTKDKNKLRNFYISKTVGNWDRKFVI